MEHVLEAIRAAIVPEASSEVKAAGANACRAVLAALEAAPGQPLAAPPTPANPIEGAVALFRGMPAEQLLDLAIARLKAALPPETTLEPAKRLTVPLLPLPTAAGRRS